MSGAEVIAEALAKHQLVSDARCSCGDHNPPWHPEIDWRGLHVAHQASVIAALPNIAVVSLPDPAFQEDGAWEWCSGRSRNAVWINDDGLIEDRFGIGQEPEDVRLWAADLLAAAAAAEEGQ